MSVYDELVDDFERTKSGAPRVIRPDGKSAVYGRPSNFGHHVENTYNLEQWKLRMVAHGVATTPAIAAALAAIDVRADKEAAAELVEKALESAKANEAADIGSALHLMSERLDRGDDFTPVEPYAADLAAYRETLDAHGLAVADGMIECHCVNDELRLAGTFDRVLVDGSGQHFIADLKTGQRVDLAQVGIAVQMAVYAHSELYDVRSGGRSAMPGVSMTRGIVVHLPAGQGQCQLYWIDLEAGWDAANLCLTVKSWHKRRDLLTPVEAPSKAMSVNARVHEMVHGPTRDRPPRGTTPDRDDVDEGQDMPSAVDSIKAAVARLALTPEQEAVVAQWVIEGDASRRPWRVTDKPSTRRFHLYRAAIRLLTFCWTDESIDDDMVRALLGFGLGVDVQPAMTVGAAIGALQIHEAKRLCDIVDAGSIRFDDSGRVIAA